MTGNLAVRLSVFFIRGYQKFISPWLGARCRFYPTCSQYAVLALTEWGFFKGLWLTVKRLARCGPWHEGGYDPPPGQKAKKAKKKISNLNPDCDR
ncbi:MAG: membrane protein insertion efficiency factor YidD [Synergistaceae bacterium]|jgi:putative membrane protein insertion efficiency factor|nr:membrane protein insertion efficiency factor YidD [Synergistaceae bacterium]